MVIINRLRMTLAKASGYYSLLQGALDCIKVLNDECTRHQNQAKDLRRQLDEQRQDFRADIEELETKMRRTAEWFEQSHATGLYELVTAAEYGCERDFLRPLTEREASHNVDMSDCQPSRPMFYLKDGALVPVTVGAQFRAEPDDRGEIPFNYASSNLYAGSECVGCVEHTDH